MENKKADQNMERSKNSVQAGGDYTNTENTNIDIKIPLIIIGVLALGGLAWALVVGTNQGGQSPQSEPPKLEQQTSE